MTQLQGLPKEILLAGSRRFPRCKNAVPSPIPFVDRVPSHWRTEKLKHVALVRFSSVDKKSEEGEVPVRLCNYTDVYNNDKIDDDPNFMRATATPDEVLRFTLKKGDVLITKDSEAWNDIAVPAYVTAEMPGVLCGYHLAHIRPNPSKLDGAFLSRAFAADGIRQQFHVAANGITRYGLPNRAIAGALFPIPPLNEQRAIAAFLDCETTKIDGLIAKKESLIRLLLKKRTATIGHAVTKGCSRSEQKPSGVDWIGNIPIHWETWRIKHVCKLETGHTPRKSDERFWVPEECNIPWISLNDTKTLERNDFIDDTVIKISALGMQNSSAHLIEAGAVVFNRDGARVGLAAITTKPMCVSQHLIAWVCGRRVFNKYLLNAIYAMNQDIYRITAGATIPTIGMTDVGRMTIPVPPISEQHEIVAFLDSQCNRLDTLVKRVEDAIHRLRDYRSSLVSAAVTGQIDVSTYRPEAPCQ